MPRTNYILTTYFGDRNNEDPRYTTDKGFFLKTHLESLARLKHSLDQITVVISGGDIQQILPTVIKNTQVVVLQRENTGMSYGALSHAFGVCPRYDFHIFMEDDYIFTQDNFDRSLIDEIETHEKCGYLCGASYVFRAGKTIHPNAYIYKTAAVSLGILRTDALEHAAILRDGKLPFSHGPNVYESGYYDQMDQSFAIAEAGWEVNDWLTRWSSAFWDSHQGIIRWFGKVDDEIHDPQTLKGDLASPTMVAPIQAIDRSMRIRNINDWHTGVLRQNGLLELT